MIIAFLNRAHMRINTVNMTECLAAAAVAAATSNSIFPSQREWTLRQNRRRPSEVWEETAGEKSCNGAFTHTLNSAAGTFGSLVISKALSRKSATVVSSSPSISHAPSPTRSRGEFGDFHLCLFWLFEHFPLLARGLDNHLIALIPHYKHPKQTAQFLHVLLDFLRQLWSHDRRSLCLKAKQNEETHRSKQAKITRPAHLN